MHSFVLRSCPVCFSESDLIIIHSLPNTKLIKCTNCTHVFFDTIPSDKDLLNHYNQYPEISNVHELTKKNYRKILTSLEKYKKTGNILDFGCSEGHFLEEAKKFGWNVYGVELIDRCINVCKRKGIQILSYDEFINVDDGFFDVITALEVIEHLSSPHDFIKKVHPKLRTGGIFIGTTPNFYSISRKIKKFNWRIIDYPDHLMYFNPKSLKHLLLNNGFHVLELKTINIDALTWFVRNNKSQQNIYDQVKIDGIRQKFEKWHTKLLKKGLNYLLNLFKIGDNLKWMAQKHD